MRCCRAARHCNGQIATLSCKLSSDFYLKMVAYGAIPLVSLLSTQFPSIGRTLLDWIQPVSQALK